VVTVRVTTLKGADAGAYYVEALPNYYLQSGEPRGVWLGDAAADLDLVGEVDDDAFLALLAGMDPRRPDRYLGRRYGEDSVRGFDVTASAPKSVSILFAVGDDDTRRQVLDAHDAAVGAMAGWIGRHAHTRYRIGGEVAVVDAEGIVAATFRQHTSRALDPQLHTHLVIANRVKSPDGRWLALDARTIKRDQRTLSAIYHAGLRAELTMRLGVDWHTPENGIAEIADVPEALIAEFSTRTGDVRRRFADKIDRFIDTMDREPTPRERWRLEREAVVDSRPAKATSVDAASLHDSWHEQVQALGLEPRQVVEDTVDRPGFKGPIPAELDDVVTEWALDVLTEQQSTWRPAELVRELAAAQFTTTTDSANNIVAWADTLADQVAAEFCVDISKPIPPGALLRRDGRPVSESALDRALTTQLILDQEHALIEWADRRVHYDGSDEPAAAERADVELTRPQADAAAAVAGYGDLVLIVGPAGTGKTTALTPAVNQLRGDGRVVFGVAPSATAAQVLAEETGVEADTIHKLLIEHRLDRPPDHRYDLPVGATVIVDEAGMLGTDKLAELADLADTRGWRIALVGDPLQFSAVGRGGMFGLMVDTFGAIELDRVHRFDNDWERDASLRLRAGDIDVAENYHAHRRIHAGTPARMERTVTQRWWELRHAGKPELLMTPTNEITERLNQRCQQTRIRHGELDPHGRSVDIGPHRVYVGDEIATRHNDRRLRTDQGDMVRNRATWTVEAIHPDHSITATGTTGSIHLPAPYVADHVELAYARTDIGGQGRNVQAGLFYTDRTTDIRNLYVAMTRGWEINEAFFGTTGGETAIDLFTHCMTNDWIDQPATTRHAELNQTTPHRPGLLDGPALRALLEERHQIDTDIGTAERAEHGVPAARRRHEQARTDTQRQIATAEHAIEHAEQILARYDRPLHRRRHQHDIDAAHHTLSHQPEILDHARRQLTDTNTALTQLDADTATAADTLKRQPELRARVADIDHDLTADRRVRTRIARLEQPDSITQTLGPRPTRGPAADHWDLAASHLHQHHAAFNINHGLGPQPRYLEHSAYTTNHAALDQLIEPIHPDPPTPTINPPTIELGL